MDVFRVPSRTIEGLVALEDGRELQGRLYVPVSGPDGRPARVLDRLNDDGERFIPLAVDAGRGLLVHKRWIRTVRLSEAEEAAPDDGEDGLEVTVRVTLNGGQLLRGTFRYTMPPDHSRLMDFLNDAPRFLPLLLPGEVVLINRDYIVCVAGLNERS